MTTEDLKLSDLTLLGTDQPFYLNEGESILWIRDNGDGTALVRIRTADGEDVTDAGIRQWPQLTPASLELFLAYANDAGNWSGNPWVDGNVSLGAAGRGNLTDLKRKGLLETGDDDGDAYIMFTAAGIALAAKHGIDLSWVI